MKRRRKKGPRGNTGPWDEKANRSSYTGGAQNKSRNEDEAREEVVREMARFGLDCGWAMLNSRGRGLPWCRALVLLLYYKNRFQADVRYLARNFVSRRKIIWIETRYPPSRLKQVSDERWSELLNRFKQQLDC